MKFFLIYGVFLFVPILVWGQSNGNQNQNAHYNNNVLTSPPAQTETRTTDSVSFQAAPVLNKEMAPAKSGKTSESTLKSVELYRLDYAIGTQRTSRSPSAVQQFQMDQNVADLKRKAPESFEYHYFSYVSGNYDTARFEHLAKAEHIRPENADVQLQMLAYGMITGNQKMQQNYADKLVNSGRLAREVLTYDRDMLNSVPPGGFLVTHGTDDTYGAVYQQLIEGVRTDVTIVSLELLQSAVYRDQLRAKGLAIPDRKEVDVTYLEQLCRKNTDKLVSLSMTIPKEYLLPLKKQLFVWGLTFRYAENLEDNFDGNETLWQGVLDRDFPQNAVTEKARELAANYLPMLFVLRTVYQRNNRQDLLDETDAAINRVATQCNKYEAVQKLKKTD